MVCRARRAVAAFGAITVQRSAQEEALLDDIIDRLLEVRKKKPGKQVQLSENEIRVLCITAKEIFLAQPNLLELEAPIKICGASTRSLQRLGCSPTTFQATFMGSTRTCSASLSTAGFPQRPTTSSSAIM